MPLPQRLRAHSTGPDADRGSISLFVVVVAVGLFVAVGLVVDGGGRIMALRRAHGAAAEAARAAGQAIQKPLAVRGEGVALDTSAAQAAAQDYLAAADVAGSVTLADGTQLSIDTTTTYTPIFLSLVGIGPMTTSGHAEVRLIRGLDGEQ